MLFIAGNSPNLAHQQWVEGKETAKCPNNFNWECSSKRGCLFILQNLSRKITFVSGFKWKNNWGNCNIQKCRTFLHYITKMWLYCVALKILLRLSSAKELHPSWPTMWCHQMSHSLVLYMLCYIDIEDEHTVHHIFSKCCLKGALISGAPNNGFLLNALKTFFRLSRVLLEL